MIPSTGKHARGCEGNCPYQEECLHITAASHQAPGAARMVACSSTFAACGEPQEFFSLHNGLLEREEALAILEEAISSFDPNFWQRMGITEECASEMVPVLKQWLDAYRRLRFYVHLQADQVLLH